MPVGRPIKDDAGQGPEYLHTSSNKHGQTSAPVHRSVAEEEAEKKVHWTASTLQRDEQKERPKLKGTMFPGTNTSSSGSASQRRSKKSSFSTLAPPVSLSAQSSSQTSCSSGSRALHKSAVSLTQQANIGVVRAKEQKVPAPPPKRSSSRDHLANIGVRRQPSPPRHLDQIKKRKEYLSRRWESSAMKIFPKQKEQESCVPPQVPDPPKRQGPPPAPRPARLPTPDLPEICSCKNCRCQRGFHEIQGPCDPLGGPGNTKMATQLAKASAHIQAQKNASRDNGSQGHPVHIIQSPRDPSYAGQSLIQHKRIPNQAYNTPKYSEASIHDRITAGVRIVKGPASVAVRHSAPRNLKFPVQGQIGNIASPGKRLRIDDPRLADIKEAARTLTKVGYSWSETMSALENCDYDLETAAAYLAKGR